MNPGSSEKHTGAIVSNKCLRRNRNSRVDVRAEEVRCQRKRNQFCREHLSFFKRRSSSLHLSTTSDAVIPRLTFSSCIHRGMSPLLRSSISSAHQIELSMSKSNKFFVGIGAGHFEPAGAVLRMLWQSAVYFFAK